MKKIPAKKETLEQLTQRSRAVFARLKQSYPDSKVALLHSSPLELLVSTILSAQCTDERVNTVTPNLFKKYRTAHHFANANPKELEQIIYSTGFYRAKAKNIINCCKMLVEKYEGKIPDTMEELIQLAGVGRKTANVVLSHAFGKTEGIVVDTHVGRLSQRLGFSKQQNAEAIERDLMTIIPKKNWMSIDNLLIWHGRKVCHARKPKCPECTINHLCPSAGRF